MDYKICNIELVNRLLAWQHTAFKTKTSFSVVSGRARETTPRMDKPPPDQQKQEPVDPLNVIAYAADFVFYHKVCCFFICLPPRCRGPPPRLDPPQNSDETEEPLMWQRNNGHGEANILQNQFTAYLVTAIRWRKIAYLRQCAKLGTHELCTDFDGAFIRLLDAMKENTAPLEQPVLESIALAQALGKITDRERYIFLARTLDQRSFEELAAELGLGYKGVAAIYYRARQKLKKEM